MDETTKPHSTSLAQTLAIQTQIHLPGTVGRLLKQIRELEQIAPLFVKAKLVRSVPRAKLLNVKVAGIATHHTDKTVAGGLLYISAGSRIDLSVDQNVVSTRDQDSVSEIDDIDFEDKSKRYQLIGMTPVASFSRIFSACWKRSACAALSVVCLASSTRASNSSLMNP